MFPIKWQEGRQPRRLLCFSAAFFMVTVIFTLLFTHVESYANIVMMTAAAALLISAAVTYALQENFHVFASVYFGLAAGFLWCWCYLYLFWMPSQSYDAYLGEVQLEIAEYAEGHTEYGTAYGLVTLLDGQKCHLKVQVYLQDGSPEYVPGDVLTFKGTFSAVKRSLRGNFLQEGYFLTLSQEESAVLLPGEALTPLRRMRILSHRITQTIERLLPGEEGALLSALISGDRNRFSVGFEQALTTSGTRHITAVSGLHVSILAGILMLFFGKRIGLLLSVPTAVAYAALVGFSPSVVRAVILLMFWATAFWSKEEKDSLTAMAAALLLLVIYNPFSAVSAGLLLSFAATLGLILLTSPINELWYPLLKRVRNPYLKSVLHYLVGTITATLAATLFTMPLNLLFFDSVPLLSLLTNVLILWAISLVMVLGIVVLILSFFSTGMAAFIARYVLYWPLAWVVKVIEGIGSLRFAATDSANLLLAGCVVLLLTATILWRENMLTGRMLLKVTAISICVCVLFTVAERKLFGVVEIENSGGQPVILLRGEGLSVLNCGIRADVAAKSVDSAKSRWNVRQLDTVLCSEGTYKTQGGLAELLSRTEVGRVLVPCKNEGVSFMAENVNALYFTDTGKTVASSVPVEVLKAGEGSYAIRIVTPKFSLLCLCGLKVEEAMQITRHYDCAADILLVDDRLANEWKTLYDLCSAVQPEQILVTSSGYSEQAENFVGVPMTLITQERVRFRFLR